MSDGEIAIICYHLCSSDGKLLVYCLLAMETCNCKAEQESSTGEYSCTFFAFFDHAAKEHCTQTNRALPIQPNILNFDFETGINSTKISRVSFQNVRKVLNF